MMQQAPGMVPPPMDPQAAAQQQYAPQGWMMPPPQQQPGMRGGQQSRQQFHQAAPEAPQLTNPDEVRTLWVGDLQYWMDENYIAACFPTLGEVLSIKVIRKKQNHQSEGYGFIEFANRALAERVLQTYNGALMPNAEQNFKLNWAFYGSGDKRGDDSSDYTIFVGDLAADVTDYVLQETFRARYQSVKGANC